MIKNKLAKFLPNLRDVYDSVRPFYIFCRIFCLCTFSIVQLDNRRSYRTNPAIIMGRVLQIFLFLTLLFLEIFDAKSIYFKGNSFIDFIFHCEYSITTAIATICTLMDIILSKRIVSVLNNIERIDMELKRLRIKISYWKVWYINICYVIFCCTYIGICIVSDYFSQGFQSFYVTTVVIISTLCYVVNFVVHVQYSNYALVIANRYEVINQYLESAVDIREVKVWISEDQQPDIKKQRKFLKSTSDSLFIVDTVASYHIKLADIAAILNQAFCVQLLLLITTSFLGIVTALFLIAINFKQPLSDDSTSYNFVFTAWAFSNTIALLIVVHTTCSLCDEANKCPRILHKIRNSTTDPRLHSTIEMYSLQMYHNRLQFHVCGLFPLDYTLLYTIVAGVTTHLVILIQFNSFDYGKIKSNETIWSNSTSVE